MGYFLYHCKNGFYALKERQRKESHLPFYIYSEKNVHEEKQSNSQRNKTILQRNIKFVFMEMYIYSHKKYVQKDQHNSKYSKMREQREWRHFLHGDTILKPMLRPSPQKSSFRAKLPRGRKNNVALES